MDKRQRATNAVIALNNYIDKSLDEAEFIKIVCDYYDHTKDETLSQADFQFLKYIANTAGIPHYYDLLSKFQNDVSIKTENLSLNTLSSQIYESTLHTSETSKVHRYQKTILDQFKDGQQNRYFLSASTSFGKTHLVYEVIHRMQYKNIVLIFPTIALLSENLEKIIGIQEYEGFEIHTLSDVKNEQIGEKNIFIYTPERFLSFIEKHGNNTLFDFIFIDEVYKIDNDYIIDEVAKESERDVSYRIAAFYSTTQNADILMAGPYIEKYSTSFERFLEDNSIVKVDFNKYEIVGKTYHDIGKIKKYEDEVFTFDFSNTNKGKVKCLKNIVNSLTESGENCIIYCSQKRYAESYASSLFDLGSMPQPTSPEYLSFLAHIKKEFGSDWVVAMALESGIGIHHGLIPKYIQKDIIAFFNKGIIRALTSTTTITEGVNTSAKNLIITNNKKGAKALKRFDAKNIAGRAGRFDQHYSGRVIILQNGFQKDIEQQKESIKHKNYDLDSPKDEVDLFYSKDEFLNNEDKRKKENIKSEQLKRGIPDDIFDLYKIVSRSDKIKIYDDISSFDKAKHDYLKTLIQSIHHPLRVSINWDGFQIILNCIEPIIRNETLSFLIKRKTNEDKGDHSILTVMVSSYLEKGFKELVRYNKESRNQKTDKAIRDASDFVYNTLKYQLVKYLGVFNIMYKFYISKNSNKIFDDVIGIDKLLTKLEYNAVTEEGRKVSDYGVPAKILHYYEGGHSQSILNQFDEYEQKIFNRVQTILADE